MARYSVFVLSVPLNPQPNDDINKMYFHCYTSHVLCCVVYRSFLHLGAGLSVGLSGLAAGFAIGVVGDAGVRGTAQQPRLFVGMILILIFAEVLGLYGLIVALILTTKSA